MAGSLPAHATPICGWGTPHGLTMLAQEVIYASNIIHERWYESCYRFPDHFNHFRKKKAFFAQYSICHIEPTRIVLLAVLKNKQVTYHYIIE